MQENVSIRQWQISDSADLVVILNNRKVQDNLRDGIPFPYTEKNGADFISAMLNADQDNVFAFAILFCGKVVGSIGAFRKDNIHRHTAETGYYLDESHWGKNICTTAVTLLCNHLFDRTDIIRIYAEPFSSNIASCRVLEKAGFQCEGTLRSNAVKNGKTLDMKVYAKIKSTPDE